MMENGPWQIPTFATAKGLNWGFVPIPTRTSSQVSQSPLGGEDYTIPNTGNKTTEAARPSSWLLTSAKNETANAAANEELPANTAAATAFAASHPSLAGFLTIIKNGRARTALLGAGGQPPQQRSTRLNSSL